MNRALKILVVLLGLLVGKASALDWETGGDVRYYQFLTLENLPGQREHSEFGVLRLKASSWLSDAWSFEIHGVLEATAPARAAVSSIATGGTRRYFDLEADLKDDPDLFVGAEIDRLTLRLDQPGYRLTIGRQAVTWGVNYFWPALDLFAPFAPQRIDRDYKPGVDAVRLTVPTGDFSEWDLILAGQGRDFSEDFSLAVLRRWNVRLSDLGLMAGSFHRDVVLGGFFVTDWAGYGVRGEIAYTRSGDDFDDRLDRDSFWRGSLGLDRQLNEDWMLTTELAWNGFGTDTAAQYLAFAQADRISRGEVNALGQLYLGTSLAWQAHPLLTVNTTLLANLDDQSMLLQPGATWSLSDESSLLFGLILGFGDDLSPGGVPRSEYGAVPATAWASLKFYF